MDAQGIKGVIEKVWTLYLLFTLPYPEHPVPIFFPGRQFFRIRKNNRNLRMPQSRRFERPRRSRSQHSNPGGASCRSSASVAQMLAAASIKVMDALFGLVARNDAECCKRELLGRTWRQDWGMRRSSKKFEDFKFSNVGYEFRRSDALGCSMSVFCTFVGVRAYMCCAVMPRGPKDPTGARDILRDPTRSSCIAQESA